MPLTRKIGSILLLTILWSTSPLKAATTTISTGPGNVFNPANVTITVGDTVMWTIGATHTLQIESVSGSGTCGAVMNPPSFSMVFNTVGVYRYHCTIHSCGSGNCGAACAGMVGMVTVNAVANTPTRTNTPTVTRT